MIIETDCMMAVDIIKESLGSTPSMTPVRKIKEMSQQFLTVKFPFVSREGNMIVDWLPRSCHSNDVDLVNIHVLTFHVERPHSMMV